MNAQQLIQILTLAVVFSGLLAGFRLLMPGSPGVSSLQAGGQPHESEVAVGADYFAGQTIEWVVPFKEGGGADTWARYISPFFTRHLPGNPVIVINNIPGGGSIKGANLFDKRSQPNGMMIFGTSGTTQMPYLLDDPRMRFDYKNYKPLMCYPNGGVVYCSPELGVRSAEELGAVSELPLKYASQGPTSLDIVPMFSFELLGLNVKAVFGFRGRGAGRLAFERGEVLIDYQTSSAYLKNVVPLVERGEAIPLFSFGALDENGRLIRDPSFPELPHFGEVYEYFGNQRKGIEWDTWFAFMAAGYGGMKLLLTPRETPEEIVAIYRDAVTKMKADPEYRQTKPKTLGAYEQVIGDRARKIFELATSIGPTEKEYMKNWLRKKYDLNI